MRSNHAKLPGIVLVVLALFTADTRAGAWDSYLAALIKDANLKASVLVGQDGAVWATTDASLKVTKGEVVKLVDGMKKKDVNGFITNGIVLVGAKYMYLKPNDEKELVARKGPTSLIVRLTRKAVILAWTKDNANPANVKAVKFVADELEKKSF